MPRKTEDKATARARVNLGKAIAKCRGTRWSQRQLALAIGLPPSNLKYIEDGVNASTADVYERLMEKLEPPAEMRRRMDRLYMTIRKAPPPDVCKVIADNPNLLDVFRTLEGKLVTQEQVDRMNVLLSSFTENSQDAMRNVMPNDASSTSG